jgi:hypothetical protein
VLRLVARDAKHDWVHPSLRERLLKHEWRSGRTLYRLAIRGSSPRFCDGVTEKDQP